MSLFDIFLGIVAVFAGAVASIAGFGIGSLLTPLLALNTTTKLAVAVVSVPHFVATFMRFWMLRRHVDRRVLLSFGVTSAVGGLLGAVLHTRFTAPALTVIFGIILILAGTMGVSGWSDKLRFGRKTAWLAGGLSGVLGGLVGNQGGIRSAAMLSFAIRKEAFVATATAIGVIVDLARMPVYVAYELDGMVAHATWMAIATVGVVLGTMLGMRLLRGIDEKTFRMVISLLVLVLGVFMLLKGVMWG
ncbi:MAG: sulfite exporter TauE/SafE family protein [Sulfurifustis sp.]